MSVFELPVVIVVPRRERQERFKLKAMSPDDLFRRGKRTEFE